MSNNFSVSILLVLIFLVIGGYSLWVFDPFSRVALTPGEVAAADACVQEQLRAAASGSNSTPLLKLDMKNAVRACEDLRILKEQQDALAGTADLEALP